MTVRGESLPYERCDGTPLLTESYCRKRLWRTLPDLSEFSYLQIQEVNRKRPLAPSGIKRTTTNRSHLANSRLSKVRMIRQVKRQEDELSRPKIKIKHRLQQRPNNRRGDGSHPIYSLFLWGPLSVDTERNSGW